MSNDVEEFSEGKDIPLDFSKPLEVEGGSSVRIISTTGPDKDYPIIGCIEGDTHILTWDKHGLCKGYASGEYDLFYAPPKEKYYATVTTDCVSYGEFQELELFPNVMAQLIVDPENKKVRIQGFNGYQVEVIGNTQPPLKGQIPLTTHDIAAMPYKSKVDDEQKVARFYQTIGQKGQSLEGIEKILQGMA